MPTSDVGIIGKLVQVIFSWFTSEDGLREMLIRKRLASKNKEFQDAVKNARTDADWDRVHKLADELRVLSTSA